MNSNKIALITGATSGIGKATAEIFAENGINLILCGRRKERLIELEKQLSNKVKTYSLVFDVKDSKAVFSSINSLPPEWQKIDFLINNAGNAHGLAPFEEGNMEDWDEMIDTNVKGLMYVAKAIVPLMIANKKGHIVNVSSVAGKEVYPNGNVYCASKFAVDALNDGMRMDLNKKGIKVSSISPGAVETEFSLVRFKGDQERAQKVYEGFQPLLANDIADLIHIIISRPSHVNIADMVVFPSAQVSATNVSRNI